MTWKESKGEGAFDSDEGGREAKKGVKLSVSQPRKQFISVSYSVSQ